jgi:hypothetical protein
MQLTVNLPTPNKKWSIKELLSQHKYFGSWKKLVVRGECLENRFNKDLFACLQVEFFLPPVNARPHPLLNSLECMIFQSPNYSW